MIDTREKLLIDKIRSLCSQLEEEANARDKVEAPIDGTAESLKLKALAEMSCDYYWVFDSNTSMIEFFYIRGKANEEMPICKSYTSVIKSVPAEQQKLISDAFIRLFHGENKEEIIHVDSMSKQTAYQLELICRTFTDVTMVKILGVTRIRHRISQQELNCVQEEEKFNVLMSLSNMFIWEYDVREDTFLANASLFHKLKLEERKYDFQEAVEVLGMPKLHEVKKRLINGELSGHGIIHIKPKNNPMDYIFETNYKPIKDKYGKCQMLIGTMEDITEKEILKTNASKDPLTNSYNRRTADMTLHSSFEKFKNGEDFYTLIFFDIDNFKRINDSFGHDMGDYVLRHVCEVISKEIRSSDMLCRWGGDEFLLICTGISKENIYAYIDRLRKLIEYTEFSFNMEKVNVTVSMGAAYYYHSDTTFEQAMKRADRSVYKSKLAGRNKVCILK